MNRDIQNIIVYILTMFVIGSGLAKFLLKSGQRADIATLLLSVVLMGAIFITIGIVIHLIGRLFKKEKKSRLFSTSFWEAGIRIGFAFWVMYWVLLILDRILT